MTKGLYQELTQTFDTLDAKSARRISSGDMDAYWTGPFSKTYTQVLFKEIDLNADGIITKNEWIAYWEMALRVGYSEGEVRETVHPPRRSWHP